MLSLSKHEKSFFSNLLGRETEHPYVSTGMNVLIAREKIITKSTKDTK